MNNKENKVLQYADDTTGLLQDKASAKEFLKTVEIFGHYSGLILNKEKTEGFGLGRNRGSNSRPLNISWGTSYIKILGVYHSYDSLAADEHNFATKISKAKRILNLWKMRNLTLFGRIQIIKTFIISQFLYVTSAIPIPERYSKEINTMIWKFIWDNGVERISRKVMTKPVDKGGLNAPDFRLMVQASKISWIKRYLNSSPHSWKHGF